VQSFTAHMPLLMATMAFELDKDAGVSSTVLSTLSPYLTTIMQIIVNNVQHGKQNLQPCNRRINVTLARSVQPFCRTHWHERHTDMPHHNVCSNSMHPCYASDATLHYTHLTASFPQ